MAGEKKSQKYFKGDQWFHRKVEGRTREALKLLNAQFCKEHSSDSNEKLLEYVRHTARHYGHTPNPGELIGGSYIASRFHGWQNAIEAAGLDQPRAQTKFNHCDLFKEEYKRQARLFKQERENAKEQTRKARQEKSTAAFAEQQRRYFRDMEWGKDHETDTDEELLSYVRQYAEESGHTPTVGEVVGGIFIAQRFGSWGVVLHFAKLTLRKGMKPPKQTTLDAYYAKQNRQVQPSTSGIVLE